MALQVNHAILNKQLQAVLLAQADGQKPLDGTTNWRGWWQNDAGTAPILQAADISRDYDIEKSRPNCILFGSGDTDGRDNGQWKYVEYRTTLLFLLDFYGQFSGLEPAEQNITDELGIRARVRGSLRRWKLTLAGSPMGRLNNFNPPDWHEHTETTGGEMFTQKFEDVWVVLSHFELTFHVKEFTGVR